MEKELFIIRGLSGETCGAFRTRMLDLAVRLAGTFNPQTIRMTLTQRRPPVWSVIPFRKNRVALFSVTGGTKDLRPSLLAEPGFGGGYLVNEAVPVAYEKTWEDGKESPGACLLTFFHKKPGLERSEFISRWFDGHTPLSLRIHPLWNYNRNEVTKTTTEGAEWYDGIVEEQMNPASDLLNPLKFFGPLHKVPSHMLHVYRDTRSFIDMKRIETYLAAEYHIRS